MLDALKAGESDPAALADLATAGPRKKLPALTEALTGEFTDHHRFMARLLLDRIDAISGDIARLDARIGEAMEPFRGAHDLLVTIPGFSNKVADVFIAETGGDMGVFPSAGQLASWAGTSPGMHESAGRSRSSKTRPGNAYLKGALGVAAMSSTRSKGTYFYGEVPPHRGPAGSITRTGRGRVRDARRGMEHAHQW